MPGKKFQQELDKVAGLKKVVEALKVEESEVYTYMELVLHGLAEFDLLSKEFIQTKWVFKDHLTGSMDEDADDDDVRGLFN